MPFGRFAGRSSSAGDKFGRGGPDHPIRHEPDQSGHQPGRMLLNMGSADPGMLLPCRLPANVETLGTSPRRLLQRADRGAQLHLIGVAPRDWRSVGQRLPDARTSQAQHSFTPPLDRVQCNTENPCPIQTYGKKSDVLWVTGAGRGRQLQMDECADAPSGEHRDPRYGKAAERV